LKFGIEVVKEELFKIENRPAWDSMCKNAELIKKAGEGIESLSYTNHETPPILMLAPRDLVMFGVVSSPSSYIIHPHHLVTLIILIVLIIFIILITLIILIIFFTVEILYLETLPILMLAPRDLVMFGEVRPDGAGGYLGFGKSIVNSEKVVAIKKDIIRMEMVINGKTNGEKRG
jgi:hypothetical protein